MSLIGNILGELDPTRLLNLILSKFPKLGQLFDLGKKVIKHFTGTLDAGLQLWNSIQSEITEFKNFKESFSFKQRVINLEKAIQGIQDLVQGIFDSYRAVIDLFKNLTTKLELGGAAEVAEAATGIGLPVALVNAIVIIVEILDTIRNVIDDLQTIVDEVTRVRTLVETGDQLFLQQRNKRKVLTLDDGTKIKIRLGKFHQ